MKTFLAFLISFCFVGLSFGQTPTTGDFRSVQDGNWAVTATWETYLLPFPPYWVASAAAPDGTLPGTVQVFINDEVTLSGAITSSIIVTSNSKLIINSGGSLIIAPSSSIDATGTLINGAGNSGLILESDASGAAQLLNSSDVDLTREVYVSGAAWHLVGSPIDGAPTTEVFDGCWMQQHDPAVAFPGDPWIWNDDVGFDATMDRGNGYSVYSTSSSVYTFTGNATASDVAPALSNGANGYNLVSNPFVCGLAWDASISLANVNTKMQVWNSGGGSYSVIDNDEGFVIPAMQGFFVNTTGGSPAITLPSGNRVVANNDNILKKSKEVSGFIRFTVNNISNSYFDESIISFDENGSESYSIETDLKKLYGSEESPDLYIVSSDEQDVVYKSLPYSLTSAVKLNLKSQVDADYEISISDLALSFGVDIYLEDVLEGETVLLEEESVYSFSSVANANENRFLLHFVGITGLNEELNNDFAIFSSYSNLIVETKNDLSYRVKVVNLLGQEVFESSNLKGDQTINLSEYKNDVLIVNLITESGSISKKIILK